MDSIFLLSAEACGRFFRNAATALGCTYICLWSPLYYPSSNYFTCKDGWHHEDDSTRPGSSPVSNSKRLFDSYRRSICNIEGSTVPGWAYKSSLPFLVLKDSDLVNFSYSQVQQQFYQESGIKTAFFLGCTSGEIEFGTTAASNANMNIITHQVFSEDFIQKFVQVGEELIQHPLPPIDQYSRPSSSSSSLRSLSAESPDQSSVLHTMATATPEKAFALSHPVLTKQTYTGYQNVPFPSAANDDATIARAMLAVISSRFSSPLQLEGPRQSPASCSFGAFSPYNPASAPRTDAIVSNLQGQCMIKTVIYLLRKMNIKKIEAVPQDTRPMINQMQQHRISEKNRRKKLNESIDALKLLLPPGSKKDKATVLEDARNYINTLKTQVSELEERNQLLEKQLHMNPNEVEETITDDSNERVKVELNLGEFEPSTSEAGAGINRLIITVRVECNMIDLILSVLECLKEMGNSSLLSVEASIKPQTNLLTKARFTLQVKGTASDEELFMKAVTAAVARSTTAAAQYSRQVDWPVKVDRSTSSTDFPTKK